jgi:hypothetical protein
LAPLRLAETHDVVGTQVQNRRSADIAQPTAIDRKRSSATLLMLA